MRRDIRHEQLVKACLAYLNTARWAGTFIRAWRNDTGRMVKGGRGSWVTSRAYGTRGASDILGIVPPHGRLLAVEVKTGRGKLSAAQKDFLEMTVRSRGGIALVCRDSVDDLDKKLTEALEE